jgi:hypothetical protein
MPVMRGLAPGHGAALEKQKDLSGQGMGDNGDRRKQSDDCYAYSEDFFEDHIHFPGSFLSAFGTIVCRLLLKQEPCLPSECDMFFVARSVGYEKSRIGKRICTRASPESKSVPKCRDFNGDLAPAGSGDAGSRRQRPSDALQIYPPRVREDLEDRLGFVAKEDEKTRH